MKDLTQKTDNRKRNNKNTGLVRSRHRLTSANKSCLAGAPTNRFISIVRDGGHPSSMYAGLRQQAVMNLQRTIGNQAVQRLIKSGALQAKLRIGRPGDRYEQEADRVADTVMRMPEPQVQRQPKEEEEEIQMQAKELPANTPEVSPGVGARINALKGGGQPLPESTRTFFEPRFGRDFSPVRVHTDAQAAESARALNAQAFTVGRDIVLGAGQYAPGTGAGRRLLAHELVHVIQQSQRPSARRIQRKVGFEFELNHTMQNLVWPKKIGDVTLVNARPILKEIPGGTVVRSKKDKFKISMDGTRIELTTAPFEEDSKGRKDLAKCMDAIDRLLAGLESEGANPGRKRLPPQKKFLLWDIPEQYPKWFKPPSGFVNNPTYAARPYVYPFKQGPRVHGAPQATVGIRLVKLGELVREIEASMSARTMRKWRRQRGIKLAHALTGSKGKKGKRLGNTSAILSWARKRVAHFYSRTILNKRRRIRLLGRLRKSSGSKLPSNFTDRMFKQAVSAKLRNFMMLVLSYLKTSVWRPSRADKELYAKAYPPIVSHTAFRDIFKMLSPNSRNVFEAFRYEMYRMAGGKSGTLLFPRKQKTIKGRIYTLHDNLPRKLTWDTWVTTIIKNQPPYSKAKTLVTPFARKYGPEAVGPKLSSGRREMGIVVELRRIAHRWWHRKTWKDLALGIHKIVTDLNWNRRRSQRRRRTRP